MPIKDAAKKALKQTKKHRILNLKKTQAVKDLKKKINKALVAKDKDSLPELMKKVQKAIDKASKAGKPLKKNTANRLKSRLSAKVNQFLKQK